MPWAWNPKPAERLELTAVHILSMLPCPSNSGSASTASEFLSSPLRPEPSWWDGMWASLLPKQAAQGLDQSELETFQGWRWHRLLGQPALMPHWHHRETVSLLCWGPELDAASRYGLTCAMQRQTIPSLDLWAVPRFIPPGAAGCLPYQGRVHTIAPSRSLIKV